MIAGHLFAHRFLIERAAGSGGMGRVYRARDTHTGSVVAVKVRASSEVEEARFRREAALLAELRHPRIVRYIAHGETPAGEAYLAMEWLDGEDLAARLARGEALGVEASVRLAQQAAAALGAAHARGVVHRDVKPSNLLLVDDRDDDVKVIDFGIALVPAEAWRLTRTGLALGTIGYMAPEQARGERTLDARVDVFALGCVLFECLTGRPPFVGEPGVSILARILLEEAPRVGDLLPGIAPALDDLVARMLAKDPGARPRDGRELAEALAALDGLDAGPARAAPVAITLVEQRVLCVLLIEPPSDPRREGGAVATTVAASSLHPVAVELSAITEAYGARLQTLADDTLVITLSGRGAATDQAARAARCALALRAVLPEARMALCTGQCETRARFPTGEVIDRAARILRHVAQRPHSPAALEGPASRGAQRHPAAAPIHLDEATTALLDLRFDARPGALGPELHGEHELFDTARTLLGKRTPFIGRDREIALLESIVAEACADDVARAVLVTAPPGTGKSRLRRELTQRLRARGEAVELWIGRGDPMRSGASFGMIADALRSAAGLRAGEPLEVRRRKLSERVARRLPPGDAQRVAEFLGEIAGAPFPPSLELTAARSDATLMADQVARAFRDLLAAECAAAPLLLVLEDLHWGDLPSVKLVDVTLRNLAERPLVVLALARPEIAETFPRLWSERALLELRLGELPRRGAERIVREVLGESVAQTIVDRIIARAAGNALYLEELIRAEANGEGDALPESVLAMVQARFSILDGEARRALRAGSIFGLEIRLPGVAALLAARPEDVAPHLDVLCERELVERRGQGHDDAYFVFRHALLRDAAYASLTPADRTLGHRMAAAWLEQNGERDALVLADHHERGQDFAEAARWFCRAAEQAIDAGDVATALARADRGVACGAHGEELGALRCVQAEVHEWNGETGAAEVRAREALDLLPEGRPLWLRAAAALITLRSRAGHIDEVIAWTARLRAIAPTDRDAAGALAFALLGAAAQLLYAGRIDVAEQVMAHVERHLMPLAEGDLLLAARLDRNRGMQRMYRGDLEVALDAFRAAARGFEAIGDQRWAQVQHMNVALVLVELGDDVAAERILRAGLANADRMMMETSVTHARAILSRVLRQRGDLVEARALAERALAQYAAYHRTNKGSAHQTVAEILAAEGDFEGALAEMRRALALVGEFRALRVEALSAYANLLLRAGHVAEALAVAREGVAMLDGEHGGAAEGESRLRLALVLALDAAHEPEAALDALRSARASLLARAARVHDPDLRRSFLERVPENVSTLALAHERLGPSPTH